MADPFLQLVRPRIRASAPAPARINAGAGPAHATRAHSKYSASGAERWFECPGSVELSEGMPDKPSPWSIEGTLAHEVLEAALNLQVSGYAKVYRQAYAAVKERANKEMIQHADHAANFIVDTAIKYDAVDIEVESRVYLNFIHPEMFGTYDGAVIDHFGTLHVFDYKYGAGHFVSPRENLQMIFYGLGVAYLHHWNFKRIRLWIIQPRVRGYDGPLFWDMPISDALAWVEVFREAVQRVEREPDTFAEGQWCHWCKAKSVCPLKRAAKLENAKSVFAIKPWSEE